MKVSVNTPASHSKLDRRHLSLIAQAVISKSACPARQLHSFSTPSMHACGGNAPKLTYMPAIQTCSCKRCFISHLACIMPVLPIRAVISMMTTSLRDDDYQQHLHVRPPSKCQSSSFLPCLARCIITIRWVAAGLKKYVSCNLHC